MPESATSGAAPRAEFVPHEPFAGSDELTRPAVEDTEPNVHLPDVPGYKLLRVAGKGGMGNVFEAIHLATGRHVALKLILTGWTAESEYRARFEREVQTLARLDHPNVVTVYDAGEWRGQPFLTMKFVRGTTLAHKLPKLRLDLPAACRTLATVARAVAYLHAEGVIHRDLKPLNVLIAEDGTPLVADFGLARSAHEDSDLTATGHPVGTQGYMSPEQIAGGPDRAHSACDIWALGVILYELLAGDRPFQNDERAAVFHLIRNEPTPPIPPHMLAPPELEAIARRCLAKNPTDRYGSATELAEHLEAWTRGEPIVLPPESVCAPQAVAPAAEPVPAERAPRSSRARVLWRAALVACAVLALASGGAPPPTGDEVLDRGDELVLLDPNGAIRVPVEPGLAGSVLHADDGFALMSGQTYQLVRFKTGPLKFPLEVSAEVMHLNPKELPNNGGLALGQQRVTWDGRPHEVFWTYGVSGGARERVGNQMRIRDRAHYQLTLVDRFDKRSYHLIAHETEEFFEKVQPANVFPLASWHRITVVLDPRGCRTTVDGKPVAPREKNPADALHKLREAHPIDGDGLAPIGDGIGLFTFGGDTAFRNVTVRRPR